MLNKEQLDTFLDEFYRDIERLKNELSGIVVGLDEVKTQLLITIFCGEHALLEGVPGIGKTLLVKTLAQLFKLQFRRIQFTPDLMPADILGTTVIVQGEDGRRAFKFEKGPVFSNIVLADEINRATPKTQSALLECMQERTITTQNNHFILEFPFIVIATENPIEMEGTYTLPEAQLDRFFMKIKVTPPGETDLVRILEKTTTNNSVELSPIVERDFLLKLNSVIRELPIANALLRYVARIIENTDPMNSGSPGLVKKYLRYGSSPRGAQSIVLSAKTNALLSGRYNVSYEDIRSVVLPALRHRIILNFEAEADRVDTDEIINEIVEATPEIK